MTSRVVSYAVGLLGCLALAVMAGCDGVTVTGGGTSLLPDNTNENANDNTGPEPEVIELEVVASNTGGAGGIALRPSDGALFLVNADGLFGPIDPTGDAVDVSTLEPFGAENLADPDLFDIETDSLVLAITNSGEFWIGSNCCVTLAVVPPEGGPAEPFTGLLEGVDASNIKAETMAIVPEGFEGPQMGPGHLLVSQETSFSRLTAIDVEGDRTVTNVDNPAVIADPEEGLPRQGHHLTFSPDGMLYTARGSALVSEPAIQTIQTDGAPVNVAGTEALSADSFVALGNGDLILRAVYAPEGGDRLENILIWSAADQEVLPGLDLPAAEVSADDEMILAHDGETIYLSLPNRNEVVRVIVNR